MKSFALVIAFAFAAAAQAAQTKLSLQDRAYLQGIAKDTWACIAGMAEPVTGLPYDNADRGEFTSVSNIGMYLASIVAAKEMNLITADEGTARLSRTIACLEKLKTSFGFQQSWNSVATLEPAKHDPWISVLDSGNLAASLVVVAQADPNLRARAMKLVDAMDWGHFYDPSQNALIGGYNTETNQLNLKWHLDLLGSDALLAQFFVVATGKAPSQLWNTFKRDTENKYGVTYLQPGWQGGGLFMQFISGLFLDQSKTEMGRSSRNFAFAQIKRGEELKTPWGWSACDNPGGGYLGWGGLKDEVVTPHACVLAIEHFPAEAIRNLRALEKLGVRSENKGFYDSINTRTNQRSRQILILDQGMLFLSLANFLGDNIIRRLFQQDATVRNGRKMIKELAGA